jgi:lipopolysaccharide transport system ATP-binding protein
MYTDPKDRFKQFFMPRLHHLFPWLGKSQYYQEFWSLRDVSLSLQRGEVMGIIGVNGAGKSSLLQLICGVLGTTQGEVQVKGRVAALLELGAGFNPDFTGRENIGLNATLLGLTATEIAQKTPEIIAFSGIEEFIDQPVKTYSSGMYVRLAFAIATSVEPDILVIDEALSVGDGAFARKSFDRIMALKDKGVTILFCSHNIYQVEALCQKAVWLDQGRIKASGAARTVCQAYNEFLDQSSAAQSQASAQFDGVTPLLGGASLPVTLAKWSPEEGQAGEASDVSERDELVQKQQQEHQEHQEHQQQEGYLAGGAAQAAGPKGIARIEAVSFKVNGQESAQLNLVSEQTDLDVDIQFMSALDVPIPNVAVIFTDKAGRNISSCSNFYDGVALRRDAAGQTRVHVHFPKIPLFRGRYGISVFLLCERAIHIYDSANVAEMDISQPGLELGVVALNRRWSA